MKKDSKIYVAGHNGMVGSAILRKLTSENFSNIVTKSKNELDLINQESVEKFMRNEKPGLKDCQKIFVHNFYNI